MYYKTLVATALTPSNSMTLLLAELNMQETKLEDSINSTKSLPKTDQAS